MKNVVLINSHPSNEKKINTLKIFISKIKENNLPIILCSGCDAPKDIIQSVDYYFSNKEKNIYRTALYSKKCAEQKKMNVAAVYMASQNFSFLMFQDVIDPTISKNTKSLFKLAEKLGFEYAYYAEDDTIVSSPNYYIDHFNILNYFKKNFCVIKSEYENIIYTTNYFANIKVFNKTFNYPSSEQDLHNSELCDKVLPWKIYEACFFDYLSQFEKNDIHFIDEKYFNSILLKEHINDRTQNFEFLLKSCVLLKTKLNKVIPMIYNYSLYFPSINAKIYINSDLHFEQKINTGFWALASTVKNLDVIKFELTDENGKCISKEVTYCSEDDILALEI